MCKYTNWQRTWCASRFALPHLLLLKSSSTNRWENWSVSQPPDYYSISSQKQRSWESTWLYYCPTDTTAQDLHNKWEGRRGVWWGFWNGVHIPSLEMFPHKAALFLCFWKTPAHTTPHTTEIFLRASRNGEWEKQIHEWVLYVVSVCVLCGVGSCDRQMNGWRDEWLSC